MAPPAPPPAYLVGRDSHLAAGPAPSATGGARRHQARSPAHVDSAAAPAKVQRCAVIRSMARSEAAPSPRSRHQQLGGASRWGARGWRRAEPPARRAAPLRRRAPVGRLARRRFGAPREASRTRFRLGWAARSRCLPHAAADRTCDDPACCFARSQSLHTPHTIVIGHLVSLELLHSGVPAVPAQVRRARTLARPASACRWGGTPLGGAQLPPPAVTSTAAALQPRPASASGPRLPVGPSWSGAGRRRSGGLTQSARRLRHLRAYWTLTRPPAAPVLQACGPSHTHQHMKQPLRQRGRAAAALLLLLAAVLLLLRAPAGASPTRLARRNRSAGRKLRKMEPACSTAPIPQVGCWVPCCSAPGRFGGEPAPGAARRQPHVGNRAYYVCLLLVVQPTAAPLC